MPFVREQSGGTVNTGTAYKTLPLGSANTSGTIDWSFTVPEGTTYIAIIQCYESGTNTGASRVCINAINSSTVSGTTATITIQYWHAYTDSGNRQFLVRYIYI